MTTAQPNRDNLIRLTTVMEGLALKLEENTAGLKSHGDKLAALENGKVGSLTTSVAVIESRLGRMEKIVYGLIAAVGIETLGIIGAIIVSTLTSSKHG